MTDYLNYFRDELDLGENVRIDKAHLESGFLQLKVNFKGQDLLWRIYKMTENDGIDLNYFKQDEINTKPLLKEVKRLGLDYKAPMIPFLSLSKIIYIGDQNDEDLYVDVYKLNDSPQSTYPLI